jgi:hypothetical protein
MVQIMEPTAKPRPPAIWLAGAVLILAIVRLYYELLLRHQAELERWFYLHPWQPVVLVAAAYVTSFVAARMTRRYLGPRLVIPCAMMAGALTMAVHMTLAGLAAGLVVGLLASFVPLRQLVMSGLRLLVAHALPVLLLSTVLGLVARMTKYADWSLAPLAHVAVYAMATPLVIVIGLRGVGRFRCRVKLGPAPSVSAARRWTYGAASLAVSVGALLIGIWLGWQADVLRRALILERVGSTSWYGARSRSQFWREGPWVVAGVWLNASARDADARVLRGLPYLEQLGFDGSQITDRGCRPLTSLRNLESLNFEDVPIHDAGLRQIAGLPNLHWLFVKRSGVTRDSLKLLVTLPLLRSADFEGIAATGTALAAISAPAAPLWLELNDCGLTDAELSSLAKWPARYLSLRDNHIVGTGLASFTPRLMGTLDLSDNPLDDRHLVLLKGVALGSLAIDGVRLSNEGCQAIQQLRSLEYVSLRRTQLTDRQLKQLLATTRIVDARLDGTHLTARSFIGWQQRDVRVYVEGKTLEARDIQRLADLGPDVYLVECELTPGSVAELAHHPRRLFTCVNCPLPARFRAILSRYVAIRSAED